MTIDKSFEWLFKRFQSKNIKPCQFDVDCMTFLAEWVNRQKEINKQHNVLFAKLYCYVFIQEINHYKDIPFAQKSMNDILKLPLDLHYQKFTQALNDIEFNKYLFSKGINPESKHYIEYPDEIEKLKECGDFLKNVNKWTLEEVTKSLDAQITESINRFNNLQ
jgi:DNA modification methylase